MSKPSFDITEAASSGLVYVKEHKKRMMIWTGLLLGPVIILGAISIFMLVALVAAAQVAGTNPGSGSVDIMSGLLAIISLPLMTSVGLSVLGKARQGEWHGIRLGKDEALMLGVMCLLVAASMGVMLVIAIVIGIAYGLGYLIGGHTAGAIIAIPLGIVAVVAMIWASLRASLIFASSLDQGTLAIVDGWKATKGHVWRLLGACLLAYLINLMVGIVIIIGLVIVGGILAGLGWWAYSAGGWFAASPFILVGVVIGTIVLTACWLVTYIISYSPYFDIWRSLKKTAPSQTAKVEDVPVSSIGDF